MGRINPLIGIGIPTWGRVTIEWARSYRHLGSTLGSTMVELAPVQGKPIAEARNELMASAIASNCEFLFMLGDDVLAPGDAIIRMFKRMQDDPDMDLCTGVYWTKQWPTAPYLWRDMQRGPYFDWKKGELFTVDYAGCDCLLIRLSDRVKALGPEWFSTKWYWEPDQGGPSEMATEDFFFYTKARKEGIKLWCDSDVQCLHEDRNGGGMFGLTTDMPQAGAFRTQDPATADLPKPSDGKLKVADIGSGFDTPWFGNRDEVEITRFDGNEKTLPDFRCDIRHLPVPDESFDLVWSRHVVEHFGRKEVVAALQEWTRILKIGGELRISAPNIMCALKQIQMQEEGTIPPHPYAWWQLYGEQTDERDFHKNGLTPKRMKLLLEQSLNCFDVVEVVTQGGEDDDLNIYAKAVKVRNLVPYSLTPVWDEIMEQEGIKVVGIADKEDPNTVTDLIEVKADMPKKKRKNKNKEKVVTDG